MIIFKVQKELQGSSTSREFNYASWLHNYSLWAASRSLLPWRSLILWEICDPGTDIQTTWSPSYQYRWSRGLAGTIRATDDTEGLGNSKCRRNGNEVYANIQIIVVHSVACWLLKGTLPTLPSYGIHDPRSFMKQVHTNVSGIYVT